jgi:hypothetical protein
MGAPVAAPPDSPSGIADDAMAALGRPPITTQNEAYRNAIASIESAGSGDYAAVGPTHSRLGRALGRYQIMEANIGPWSREVLGREVTPQEFMANPQIQDAIFDGKFGGYVQQFGPEGAAQAWFAGPGGVGKMDRQDVLGTSVGEYSQKFARALGQPSGMGATGGVNPQSQGAMLQIVQQLTDVAANPYADEGQKAIAQALLGQVTAQMQPPDPMQAIELEKAQLELEQLRQPQQERGVVVGGQIVNPVTGAVIYQPEEGAQPIGEFGLQPVFGKDANGNTVIMQLGKDGSAVVTQLPEGVTPDLAVKSAEAERGKALGQAEADALTGIGGAVAKAEITVDLIDQIIADPALPSITGMIQGTLPAGTPVIGGGQAGIDLNTKIEQLKGRVFLEAFESLKGAGQITEREGAAAQAALARLDRAQSVEAYTAALTELRTIVVTATERAKARADRARRSENGEAPAAPASAPETFETFAASPSAIAAAKKYGVTLEEMWDIKQGQK